MTEYHKIANFSLSVIIKNRLKLLNIVFNIFHVLQFTRSSREKATGSIPLDSSHTEDALWEVCEKNNWKMQRIVEGGGNDVDVK